MSASFIDAVAFDAELDAKGLACPLPLLKTKLMLNQLPLGAVLKVLATDPSSQKDLRSFARLSGHELVHESQAEGCFYYWIRKA